MDAVHSYHSAIFDTPKPKKLKLSFFMALLVAALLHVAGAWYLVHQRFAVPSAPPEDPPILIDNVPLDKPEKPKPTKPATPPPPKPTTLTPRKTESPIPDKVETTPIAPSDKPADDGSKTPPIISDGPPTVGPAIKPAPPAYVTAKWTRFPDSEALLSYYPPAAVDNEVEGQATLECVVADAKGRVTCSVLAESPKGYGFGRATVKMVQDKGRVDTTQGDVQVGSKLRTVVKWTLG